MFEEASEVGPGDCVGEREKMGWVSRALKVKVRSLDLQCNGSPCRGLSRGET